MNDDHHNIEDNYVDSTHTAFLTCGMPVILILALVIRKLGGKIDINQAAVDEIAPYMLVERRLAGEPGVTLSVVLDDSPTRIQVQ